MSSVPSYRSPLRNEVYEMVINEMDERHYGGKWFPASDRPLEHWVDLGVYSAVFRRKNGTESFCLPAPYFRLLSEFFA